MIFEVQHFLEDYFHRRNLSDVDQYAVKLANLYARRRGKEKDTAFVTAMRRLQTVFYKNNPEADRTSVERDILRRLDSKFQKKKNLAADDLRFSAGFDAERAKLRRLPRRSIAAVLNSFKHAVEARAVDTIWESRVAGRLRPRPEKVAQGLLSVFVMRVLADGGGQLLRELASGVGFVDVVVMFGAVPHLVEMKILRGTFSGVAQLQAYMKTEKRTQGWLVVFDARAHGRRPSLPAVIRTKAGTVNVVVIDVNPLAPSRHKSN
jgi:hypothetical protein